jgi:hypothetical protein
MVTNGVARTNEDRRACHDVQREGVLRPLGRLAAEFTPFFIRHTTYRVHGVRQCHAVRHTYQPGRCSP